MFFYRLPFHVLDLLWYAKEHSVPQMEAARVMGLTEVQVGRAFDDIDRKIRTTDFLRLLPPKLGAPETNSQ